MKSRCEHKAVKTSAQCLWTTLSPTRKTKAFISPKAELQLDNQGLGSATDCTQRTRLISWRYVRLRLALLMSLVHEQTPCQRDTMLQIFQLLRHV